MSPFPLQVRLHLYRLIYNNTLLGYPTWPIDFCMYVGESTSRVRVNRPQCKGIDLYVNQLALPIRARSHALSTIRSIRPGRAYLEHLILGTLVFPEACALSGFEFCLTTTCISNRGESILREGLLEPRAQSLR